MDTGDMRPRASAGGCKAGEPGVSGCTTNQHMLPEAARGSGNSQAAVTTTTGTVCASALTAMAHLTNVLTRSNAQMCSVSLFH